MAAGAGKGADKGAGQADISAGFAPPAHIGATLDLAKPAYR